MSRLLFIVFFFFQAGLSAQPLVFQTFTESDGLPDNTITSIRQSADGFLWIGTTNGLSRFDGINFKNYRSGSGINQLSFSHIQDIEIENERYIWISTRQGLNRLDLKTETFLQLTSITCPTIPSQIGHDVFRDEEGRIWYTSDNRNPGLWLPDEKGFMVFPWKEWVIKNQHSAKTYYLNINRMVAKKGNKIWLCTNVGLYDFNVETGKFGYFPVPEGKFREFTDAYDDENGLLWLNTGGGEIQIYDYLNNKWLLPLNDSGPNPDTDLFTQWAIIPTGTSTVMAALTIGLSIWDTQKRTFNTERHEPDRPWSLPDGKVITLFEDREEIIWVGTTTGLAKIDPARQQFKVNQFNTSSNNDVASLWENPDDNSRFISVTGMGSLALINPGSGTVNNLFQPDNLPFDNLLKMIPDNQDNLWLMEFNGISRLDLSTGKIRKTSIPADLPDKGDQVQFNDGAFDGRTSIYFSSDKAGLVKFDISDETFHKIYVQDKNYESQIKAVHWDESLKAVWFSSRNGWLGKYLPEQDSVISYFHEPGNPQSLVSPMVVGITQLPDGTMCFITDPGGISLLNPAEFEKGLFKNYTTDDGLPVNLFTRVQADEQGRLWLLHKNGLCFFDPKSGDVRNYGKDHGLEFPTMMTRFSRSHDGHLFVGARGGYLRFHPDSLFRNGYKPNPVITSFKIVGKEYLPLLSDNDYSLNLPYNQNSLTISFATLNFIESENNKTTFRLLGEETYWQSGKSSETVAYLKLIPGKYRFQLKATNSSGIEKSLDKEFELTITPHFTQTFWFKGIMVLGFLMIVYAFYRMRINQILNVQRMRNKIAADLHDDVASTISSITFYSDYASENTSEDNPKVQSTLKKISESARESLEIMREIVWAIQTDKDSFLHLKKRMQDYAMPVCKAKNIQFNWIENQITGKWTMELIFRRNVYLIFKEAVNNALKYADCSEISVGLSRKGRIFEMEIRDNGKGMDPSGQHSGNGIKNMKLRSEQINGTIQIDSLPGQGTSIRFEVRGW